jgi:hypothetical protein
VIRPKRKWATARQGEGNEREWGRGNHRDFKEGILQQGKIGEPCIEKS